MQNFSALAATVEAGRLTLLVEERRERDRAQGIAALRPSIDVPEARVLPDCHAARAALAPAGIRLAVTIGWSEKRREKSAPVAIVAQPTSLWAGKASSAVGDRVIIQAEGLALSFRRRITTMRMRMRSWSTSTLTRRRPR